MKFRDKLKAIFFVKIVKPRVNKLYRKENSIAERTNAITANEQSPNRFDIPLSLVNHVEQGKKHSLITPTTARHLLSNIRNIGKSVDSLKKNPKEPIDSINEQFLQSLLTFSKEQGTASIGFTKLPQKLIFREKAVLHDNAIVLTMEMDKKKIAKAPHKETVNMVLGTYDKLGITTNKIAKFLRKHGYSAHTSHPLGGIVLYPPLAQQAALGWVGKHGLLITPEFGPRVRLAAIFTNIKNLPFAEDNPHNWIPEYCATCGNCIKNCPTKAVFEEPIKHENGLVSHIDGNKCFPYFAENYGCSVCIKVCHFNLIGYEKLRSKIKDKEVE